MPFICFKITYYSQNGSYPLTNYPTCGYISIDGGAFKKLYYGAVFEVDEGEHSIVCVNDPKLNPKKCARDAFIKDYGNIDSFGFVKTFFQQSVFLISANIYEAVFNRGKNYTDWRMANKKLVEACTNDSLTEFFKTQIFDWYSYLSQRAVHMSGPVSRKTAMEEAEKDYTDETPTYTPSEHTKYNTSGGNDAFMTVAGIILIIAVVGLIIWWAWPLLSYIIEDIFKPLFSEIAENLSNLEWKI